MSLSVLPYRDELKVADGRLYIDGSWCGMKLPMTVPVESHRYTGFENCISLLRSGSSIEMFSMAWTLK